MSLQYFNVMLLEVLLWKTCSSP